MFRTIWDWLGIEETRDKALIRKAYARQAKKYHPEDMPEEARQLREAYKIALALATEDKDTGFPEHKTREEAPDKRTQEDLPKEADNDHRYNPELREKTETVYQYNFGYQGKEHIYPKSTEHFDYFHFDESRAKRLGRLEDRLNSLYRNKSLQNSELWSDAIKKFLTVEDLKDARVVAAVLSILTQMSGLERRLWDAFEKELFCYCGNGAEWTWLKTQFMRMRREDGIFTETQENAQAASPKAFVGPTDPVTGDTIPEKSAQKRGNADGNPALVILIIIACCFVYFFMFYLFDVILALVFPD